MREDAPTPRRLSAITAIVAVAAVGALAIGVASTTATNDGTTWTRVSSVAMLGEELPEARPTTRARVDLHKRLRGKRVEGIFGRLRAARGRAPRFDPKDFDVDADAVASAARELHRRESYAFVNGELVGDRVRRAWARKHAFVAPWGSEAPPIAILGKARKSEDEDEDEVETSKKHHHGSKKKDEDEDETSKKHHHGSKKKDAAKESDDDDSKKSKVTKKSKKSKEEDSAKESKGSKKKASKKGKDDDDSAMLGKKEGKKSLSLDTPVYIMTLGDKKLKNPDPTMGSTDAERASQLIKLLVREFGTKDVKKHVRLTPGVDVYDWPKNEDTMHYALKTVMANKPKGTQLSALPWISFYTSRDKSGHFADKFAEERNLQTHIGCLFGHMFQWQLASDAGDEEAFMFESDASNQYMIGLPVKSMVSLVDHAPKGYDIIFFDEPKMVTFDKPVRTYKDENGMEINIYAFNQKSGQSGLSASLVSKRFYPKLFKHVAHFGADVVDAMLKVQLCADSMVDASGKFTGFGAGNKPWLKCYWALPAKAAHVKDGKYVYN